MQISETEVSLYLNRGLRVSFRVDDNESNGSCEYFFNKKGSVYVCYMYRSNMSDPLRLSGKGMGYNDLMWVLTRFYPSLKKVGIYVYPKEWDPCFGSPEINEYHISLLKMESMTTADTPPQPTVSDVLPQTEKFENKLSPSI